MANNDTRIHVLGTLESDMLTGSYFVDFDLEGSYIAVSYTHLDVYKRQDSCISGGCAAAPRGDTGYFGNRGRAKPYIFV